MSNTYKNTAFWSWNAKIEKEEALRQLSDLKEKGYGGAFVHARGGLEIEYMGAEWFDILDACVEWAAANSFDIWLYDEFGWPSGFGGGKVNGLGAEYQIKRLVGSPMPLEEQKQSLLQTYEADGKPLYVYLSVDKNYVDLLDPKVTQAFIQSTHEVYYARYKKYFGRVVKGIFTDEPQIAMHYPYSGRIVEAFREKFGLDFHEELWRLFVENPRQSEFFYRYYSVIAELLTENFTKPIAKWCEEHGIKFTGHFAAEDGLTAQYRATGGVMRNYEPMQQPGIDFLGRRLITPVLLKQLVSVKNQFGKDTVLSESFGCSGWSATFAQFAWMWGYQVAFGVNKACLHLSAYTIRGTRKRDYPAFFSYQEPWWECFGALSAEMERMSAFVSEGRSAADILVVSPLTSMYFQPYEADRAKTLSAQFRMTLENLIAKQYPFDIGDERLMKEFGCVTEDGRLRVGECAYAHVLVAEAINLENSTWALLKAFTEKGGKLAFVNARPEKCAGEDIPEEYSNVLKSPVLANRAAIFEKYFRAVGYGRRVKITDVCDGQVCDELILNVTETETELHIFAQNVSCGRYVEGRLTVAEPGSFYEDGNGLGTAIGRKGAYTRVHIPPMGRLSVRFVRGEKPAAVKKKFLSETALPLRSARLTADNSLNIDKAYFEIDGERSGLFDTALLQDEINRAVNGKSLQRAIVNVTYAFEQAEIVERLRVAAETQGTTKIVFNDVDIGGRFDGWYVDKSIRLADVSDLQRLGENTLVISYPVCGQKGYTDMLDVFETERNLFHYQSEAESVYLVGTFSIENKSVVYDDGYLTTKLEKFVIGAPRTLDFERELTAQGLYFYRGAVEYRYTLRKNAGESVGVRFEDFHGVTATLKSNGKETTVVNPWAITDITELLTEGENELVVTLYGSNRNLFGPFHHRSGDPALVGPSSFRGKKGFEDAILYDHFKEDTYEDVYHFVKLGIGSTIAVKYRMDT